VCGFLGAGQGATTRNGRSIPRSCNAAMRPENRAIRHVAAFANKVKVEKRKMRFVFHWLNFQNSGQLPFLGSTTKQN
jgi:hypothetical protein